jgi:hypothetical protein
VDVASETTEGGPGREIRLTSRTPDFFDAAQRAAEAGEVGERVLVEALARGLSKDKQLYAVVALGDATGPLGARALREALTWAGASQDLRCAALLALTKREKVTASGDLADAFNSPVAAIRGYAAIGLAAYGDDRAWEAAFSYVQRRMHVSPNVWPPTTAANCVAYLLRHLDEEGARGARLVALLRAKDKQAPKSAPFEASGASSLGQHWAEGTSWIKRHWPDCLDSSIAADQVRAPDVEAVERWARDNHLLQPLRRASD